MSRSIVALLALLALLTAHCGDDDETPPDDGGETCSACLTDFGKNDKKLCPEPQSEWNCVDGCCVPVFTCQADADCTQAGFDEGQCSDERYECRCDLDTGGCFEWLCASNDECGEGEVCDAGACAAVSDLLSLRLVNRVWLLTAGSSGQLHAEAFDSANPELGLPVEVVWSSDDESVVSVDDTGVVTGGDVEGTTMVGAQVGDDPSTRVVTEIRNVVPASEAALTVVALYERSMESVTGRYVVVSATDTEMVTSGAIPQDGVISVDATAAGPYDVHIFAERGDWISWLNATGDGEVLFLPVPRTAFGSISLSPELDVDADKTTLDGVNILRGVVDFADYDKEGEFELTLSSFAFSSGLFDFSLETLLGPNVERYFDPNHNLPGVDAGDTAEVPGGVTFGLGGPAIPEFHLSPSKGSHRVWTLGGRIAFEQVAPVADQLFDAFGGSQLDFGLIVGTLFPAFVDFWSAVGDVEEVAGDGDMSVLEYQTRLAVPLGLSTEITPALLPAMGDLGVADAVFILAGALTPDLLFVPLGLNADTDSRDPETDIPDRRVDGDDTTEAIDPQHVPFAPLHSGLGGPFGRYAIAIVAAAIPDGDDPRPDGGSAVLLRYAAGEQPPLAVDAPDFLGFPMGSEWNAENRTITATAVDGAPIQRVLFKHKHGRHWTVWLNGRDEIVMPTPQDYAAEGETLEDRTETIHLVLVNSFDLIDGLELDDIARPGGANLDGLLEVVDRASFMDVRP